VTWIERDEQPIANWQWTPAPCGVGRAVFALHFPPGTVAVQFIWPFVLLHPAFVRRSEAALIQNSGSLRKQNFPRLCSSIPWQHSLSRLCEQNVLAEGIEASWQKQWNESLARPQHAAWQIPSLLCAPAHAPTCTDSAWPVS